MVDTRCYLRLAVSGLLVASTFTIAACGHEPVTRTTTVERTTEVPVGQTTTTTTQSTAQ